MATEHTLWQSRAKKANEMFDGADELQQNYFVHTKRKQPIGRKKKQKK